jgi:membrane protease subunit HflK
MKEVVISLKRLRMPAIPRTLLLRGGLAVLALFLASEMLYEVQPEELGLVMRFGRYVKTVPPGLHVDLPFIDSQVMVPAQRQLKQEFGFTRSAEHHEATKEVPDESLMLTGDLSVAKVQWVVQYRIADAYKYTFRVRDADGTLRDLAEAVMRQVVGDRSLTEVLTVGRAGIESQVQADLQALATDYDMGITIEQVALQAAAPPDPVKPAWDQVTQAQQQRDRRINEARGQYNKVVPRAKG